MNNSTKYCTKCKTTKLVSEFYKCKSRSDGLQTCCKPCKTYQTKKWYKENQKEHSEMTKQHYKDNRDAITKRHMAYNKMKRETDSSFRLLDNLRRRVRSAIKNGSKSSQTLELLGCTIPELREHLESKFQTGMSWDNYGLKGWHVDHVRPCSSYNLSNPDQQRECFNHTNLQPLWATENLEKGDRFEK